MEKTQLLAPQNPLGTALKLLSALLVTLGVFSAQATLGPKPILCEAQAKPTDHGGAQLDINILNKGEKLKLQKSLSADEFAELLDMSFTAKEALENLEDHKRLEEKKAKNKAKKLEDTKPKKKNIFSRMLGKLRKSADPLGLSSFNSSSDREPSPLNDGDELRLIMPIENLNTEMRVNVDPIGLILFSKIYKPRIQKMADQESALHFFTGMEFNDLNEIENSYRYISFAAHCTLTIREGQY